MKQRYERPDAELIVLSSEEKFLLSGGDGTSESVGYDEDPFGGGN